MYWYDCLYKKKTSQNLWGGNILQHIKKFNRFKPQSMFIVWIFILPFTIVFCYSRVLNKNSSDFNRHCLNNTVASKNLNKKILTSHNIKLSFSFLVTKHYFLSNVPRMFMSSIFSQCFPSVWVELQAFLTNR